MFAVSQSMKLPNGKTIFIDTTVLYALLDPTHEAHEQVSEAWHGLLSSGASFMTTSYVCAELLALVQVRLGVGGVQAFQRDLGPSIRVLTVDSRLHARALATCRRNLGELIHQTSLAFMSEQGVTTVFTLDARFAGNRFRAVELRRREHPSGDERPAPISQPALKSRPPRRHGARRAMSRSGGGASVAERPPPFRSRPELICRRAPGSWHWEVVLSAPDDCQVAVVCYRGRALRSVSGEYRLTSFSGALSVSHADGTEHALQLCTMRTPMIFKLADRWSGVGRRMDAISRGHFIVIAPTGWNRIGSPPVAPEATVDPAFQAHYFFRDGGPASDSIGFEECDLSFTRARYSLIGDRLYDDSTEGELFIARPPELEAGHGVTWARVGDEKEGGWRGENFLPAKRSLADVLGHRQGRFFVRVYDSSAKLCDSGEFRYVESLRKILVDGRPHTPEALLLPSDEGHTPVKIQLLGEGEAVVRPSLIPSVHHRWVEEEAAIVADPLRAADEVACTIETPQGSMGLLIRLPRIWWYLGGVGEPSAAWSASPIKMTRSEFRNYVDADAAVRISLPRAFHAVDVGLNLDLSRSYRSRLTQDAASITEIPLIDFADDSPIDRTWEDTVLNARCGMSVVPLVQILAEAVPEIVSFHATPAVVRPGERATLRWMTRNAKDGTVSLSPKFGKVPRKGSITFTPQQTTRYEISIAIRNREELTRTVLVTVTRRPKEPRRRVVRQMADSPTPQIVLFCARPVAVRPGGSATLYWTTRNAQAGSVLITPEIGRVPRTGSIKVSPERTTRYRIAIVTESDELSLPQPRHAVVDVVHPRGKRR